MSKFWIGAIAVILLTAAMAVRVEASRRPVKSHVGASTAIKASADIKIRETLPKPAKSDKVQVPILMYHYIRDYHNPKDKVGTNLSVSPETFKKQLGYLKEHQYRTVNLEQMRAILKGETAIEKPVVLTFDDGYDDAFSQVLPQLVANRQIGVFYLVSGFLNRDRYLSSEQVKQLDRAGMEIAAHTVTHVNLETAQPFRRRQQLEESKKVLEDLIGKPVLNMAYPSGRYNQDVVALVKTLGYRTAVTTHPGIASKDSDLLALPRLRMTELTDLSKILP